MSTPSLQNLWMSRTGKKCSVGVMKLMDLAMGRWSLESHKSLQSKVLPGCDTGTERGSAVGFEDGGEAVRQGVREASRIWKSQVVHYPLELPERNAACHELDFNPSRPMSGF